MLQQLQQQGGNPILMGPNGMFPSNSNLAMQMNPQKSNPNQNGMPNMNAMFAMQNGMQNPNNQDMANMMRQQQMA
jgi:hypothetical protein